MGRSLFARKIFYWSATAPATQERAITKSGVPEIEAAFDHFDIIAQAIQSGLHVCDGFSVLGLIPPIPGDPDFNPAQPLPMPAENAAQSRRIGPDRLERIEDKVDRFFAHSGGSLGNAPGGVGRSLFARKIPLLPRDRRRKARPAGADQAAGLSWRIDVYKYTHE